MKNFFTNKNKDDAITELNTIDNTIVMPICQILNLEDLRIAEYTHTSGEDTSYQRTVRNNKVNHIVGNFDADIIGIILVSHRDGAYYIIDGQHRVEALRRLGSKNVLCQVLTGLTYEEEAEKFEKLNTNRTALTPINKFNARIEAKDNTALSIISSLKKYGFDCPRKTNKSDDNLIGSVSSLEKIYNKNGVKHFESVLKLIRVCWNGDKRSLQASIILGLSNFLYNHSVEMNEQLFIKAMKSVMPDEILLQATVYRKSPIRAIRDDNNAGCVVRVMEDLYNSYAKRQKISLLSNDYA